MTRMPKITAVSSNSYQEWREIRQRLVLVSLGLVFLFTAGIAGYMLIEHWNLLDATYMTVITLATIGFGETHPLSSAGRIFTIGLILGGMVVLTYGLTQVTAFFVEGYATNLFRRAKMEKQIERLTSHTIVCGAGRTGRYVIEEMVKMHHPFVVIDQSADQLAQLPWPDMPTVCGNAAKEGVLAQAGIERARALVAALPTDSDNVFVVLTARGLNPRLQIISKGNEEESRDKLVRAGADSVVLEYFIGGLRMASLILRPAVVSFLDIMLREQDKTLRIEQAEVRPGSSLICMTVGEAAIGQKTGLNLLAIRRPDQTYQYNPEASAVLNAGDALIVFGEMRHLESLRALSGG